MSRVKLAQWVIVMAFGISGFAIGIYGFYLDDFYYRTAPRMPDEANGRVVRENVHKGTIVYLTVEESEKIRYSPFIGFGVFMIGAILAEIWNIGQPHAQQNTINAYVPPVKNKWIFW
jgi:hypothetical protein